MPSLPYKNSDSPHGIIKRLQREYGTNISKYISISANSILDNNIPENMFNLDGWAWITGRSVGNPHATFCFTHHLVPLKGHQIHPSDGDCRLKNWKIYGSNKPEVWEMEKSFSKAFEKYQIAHFEMDFPFFQCFKFEMIGQSQCGTYQTDVLWLELYGSIKQIGKITCFCSKQRKYYQVTLFVLIIST